MKDLYFENGMINLPDGQLNSIVLDDVVVRKEKNETITPILANYYEIVNSNNSSKFDLKRRSIDLTATRDLTEISNTELPVTDLTQEIHSFTVKSFPHFGAYGFINYSMDENSAIMLGIDLKTNRDSGGLFDETN